LGVRFPAEFPPEPELGEVVGEEPDGPPDEEPGEPPDEEPRGPPDEPPDEIPDPEDGPIGAGVGCQTPVVYSAVRRTAIAETNPAIPVSNPGSVFQNDLVSRGAGSSIFRVSPWVSSDPIPFD